MILVPCECGAKLRVKDEVAGHRVKCPRCSTVIRAPKRVTPPADDDSLLQELAFSEELAPAAPRSVECCPICGNAMAADEMLCTACAGSSRATETLGAKVTCPSCKRTLPAKAKICVPCGINIQTGRALLTADDNTDTAYVQAEALIPWVSIFAPLGIYPIVSEAFGTRKSYCVRTIAVVTIAISVWFLSYQWTDSPKQDSFRNLMLWCGTPQTQAQLESTARSMVPAGSRGSQRLRQEVLDELAAVQEHAGQFHWYQLITNAFLHAGILHLAGNLLFLMVFGSRVNALIGNLWTAIVYPLLAVVASLAHMIATSKGFVHPALGASGAIMGMAGMYLVLFPIHKVHTAVWLRIGGLIRFWLWSKIWAIRGFWVVLFYIASDVILTCVGAQDGVAHWAHLGGFIGGTIVGLILLCSRLVNARGGDLLSALLGQKAWSLVGKPRTA